MPKRSSSNKYSLIDTHGLLPFLLAKAERRRVITASGCHEFPGSDNSGYPVILLPKDVGSLTVQIGHLVWKQTHGRWVADNKYLLHTCDNKLCATPGHLYEGTCRENALDHCYRVCTYLR